MFISLVYSVCSGPINQRRGSRLQGYRTFIIIFFVFVTATHFLKPYLHMNQHGELRVDRGHLIQKFRGMEVWTPSVGLAFGILACSSTLSQ